MDLNYSQLGCEQEYTQDTLTFMDYFKSDLNQFTLEDESHVSLKRQRVLIFLEE